MRKNALLARKHVTQKDVARRAGVTQATVSMVISKSKRVNPSTRFRVEQAIEELGYVANLAARSLVTRSTHVLSLVTPDLSHESEQFMMPLMQGLLEGLQDEDFVLDFCLSRRDEDSYETIKQIVYRNRVAGMFILSPHEEETRYVDFLMAEKVPFVLVNRQHENKQVACVAVDYADIAYRAVRYLHQKGHRAIGFINGPENRPSSRARLRGVRMALMEHELESRADWMLAGNFQLDGGYRNMKQLLQAGPPTAVFAGNDFQALGAIQAIHGAGLELPDDLAVIGCDDWEMSRWIRPPLTTIRVPFHEMGIMAAQMLCRLVRGERIPIRQVIFPSHLIERKSV